MTPAERLARIAATSDDPDTQTACYAADRFGQVLCETSNTIPIGVRKLRERLLRPDKYDFIQHAEANLVAAPGNLTGSTVYLNWFPCSTCASLLVTAGIARLVADRAAYEARKDDPRYGFANAMAKLTEAGVEIEWM